MKFGLIGFPLGHSFSKSYYADTFKAMGLDSFSYDLFPLEHIDEVIPILQSEIFGFNVTIPYKTAIIDYLNDIDQTAFRIGAVNTVVRSGAYSWKGFNTDATGFKATLLKWIGGHGMPQKALVLGTGGSSKAITFVLRGLGIDVSTVSRTGKGDLTYEDLSPQVIQEHLLIINTTPAGMEPDTQHSPAISYADLTSEHWLYDLVYNPINTLFLTRGQQMGARTKNGLEMLHLQADHAWAIWKTYGKF